MSPTDDQPPNRVLLYVEALVFLLLLGIVTMTLGSWCLPVSGDTHLTDHLGILFGIAAVILFGSVCSAARRKPYVLKVFHGLFHMSILGELTRVAYVALPTFRDHKGTYITSYLWH
jgi:hypothetical protein